MPRSGDKSHQMPSHTERLEVIRNKATALARQYKTLEAEHAKLRSELDRRDAAEAQWRERTQALEKQLQLLKAASGLVDEKGRKELEKRINHYIREIDRCITLLGEGH
jgi:chromosome segregation ATPase